MDNLDSTYRAGQARGIVEHDRILNTGYYTKAPNEI